MASADRFERFVTAQQACWHTVLAELAAGQKRGHWMWFVFPQLAGLGTSATARHYALAGLADARAYLAHPVLGPRLRAAVDALLKQDCADPERILGPIDALKLRSSLTLFATAGGGPRFEAALMRFHAGQPDPRTLALLQNATRADQPS